LTAHRQNAKSFSSGRLAQVDRALVSGTKGHAFESRIAHHNNIIDLSRSRVFFYPFIKAFEFFGGVYKKGIYDNLKTVVNKIIRGKERNFNSRFAQLSSHYLFEPVSCTPGAGWEKGQVEN
jgi:hypothetical protein